MKAQGHVPHFLTDSHMRSPSKKPIVKMNMVVDASSYVPGQCISGNIQCGKVDSLSVEVCGYEEVIDKSSQKHRIHTRLFLRVAQEVHDGTFVVSLPVHANLEDNVGDVRMLPGSFWNGSFGGIRYIVTGVAKKNGNTILVHKEIQVLQPALPIFPPLEFSTNKQLASGSVTLTSRVLSTRWISGTKGRVSIEVSNDANVGIVWCRASLVRILATHGRSFDPVQRGTYAIDASRKIVSESIVTKGKDLVSALLNPTTSVWSEDVVFGNGRSNRACEYWNGVGVGQSKSLSLDVTVPPFAADVRGAFCQVEHVVQVSIGCGGEIFGVCEVPVVVVRSEAVDAVGMTGKIHSIIGLSSFRSIPAVSIPSFIQGHSFVQPTQSSQSSQSSFVQRSVQEVSPVSPPSPTRTSSLRKMEASPIRTHSLTNNASIGINLFGARAGGSLIGMHGGVVKQPSKPVLVERISEWDAIEM
jgi:hypothetical protein